MPRYRYEAIDAAGRVQRGEMEAASEAEVAGRMQAQGSMLLRADLPGALSSLIGLLHVDLTARRGLHKKTVAALTRELAVLLGAGQQIDHALRFMAQAATDAHSRRLLADLRERVRGGKSVASALAAHPQTFSRLYVGMVTAGEAGGTLAQTLDQLAGLLERDRSLALTLQSALAYPLILMAAAIGSIAFLVGWVLPQFAQVFADAHATLPVATRFLLSLGEGLQAHGALLFVAVAAVGLAIIASWSHPRVRRWRDALVARLPVVGPLVRQTEAARLTRTLGTLLVNGVGLLHALAICRQVLSNTLAVSAVTAAETEAKAGGSLADALAGAGFFPAHCTHLLRLGAETGALAAMALRAADIHEEQARAGTQRLLALLVPAITVTMGLLVAAIIGSLMVAMMSLNDLVL